MMTNFITTKGTELGADARTSGSFVISTFRVLTPFHYVQANSAPPLLKLINIRSAFRALCGKNI